MLAAHPYENQINFRIMFLKKKNPQEIQPTILSYRSKLTFSQLIANSLWYAFILKLNLKLQACVKVKCL